MRRLTCIIFILLFLSPYLVKAQRDEPIMNLEFMDQKAFQWGYYFGINQLDFKIDLKELDYSSNKLREIQTKKGIGFNVGVTSSLRITDYLHLRFEPGLFYNQRDLYFSEFTEKRDMIRSVRSTYVYFPLLLKVSTQRWYNFKPYVTAGSSATINLSSGSSLKEDNYDGRFRTKQYAFFYELGIGVDFFTPYFRFSPSIRGVFSYGNEMIRDNNPNSPWTGNIDGIRTQGILLNFTFE